MKSFLTCILGAFGMASAAWAELSTVAAPDALKAIGFKDMSYLLTTSETVTELLSGDYNLQANSAVSGGAVVTLGNEANTFTGGTYVKSGTLVVPAPGALGNSSLPIVLGNGTIRFTDTMTISREITGFPEADQYAPNVLVVDEGKTVTTTARMRRLSSYKSGLTEYFHLVKRGPGTFILANQSGENKIGYNSGTINALNYDYKTAIAAFPENGDSPANAAWGFAVFDGRFVIDTPNTVSTIFPKFAVGAVTTTNGQETAGHFEVRGGRVETGNIWLGLMNGNKMTAPEGLSSSIDVSGGSLKIGGILYMGETGSKNSYTGADAIYNATNSTAKPVVNVSGDGKIVITGEEGIRFGSPVEATINISGNGELTVPNITCGKYGRSGQTIRFNLSDNAKLNVTNRYEIMAAGGVYESLPYSSSEIVLSGNSVFAMRSVGDKTGSYYDAWYVKGDGGTLKLIQASAADEGLDCYGGGSTGRIYVRTTGLTVDVSDVAANGPKWRVPFLRMNDSNNGWVSVVGAGKGLCLFENKSDCSVLGFQTAESKIHLGGREKYSTEFKISGSGAISARGWVEDTAVHTNTVDKLTFGATGTLEVGHSTDAARTPSLLVAKAFTPPTERLDVKTFKTVSKKVTNEEEAPLGAYEILKFPRTVAFDPSLCRYSGSVRGLSVEFSVVDDGTTWKTLKMDVMKRGAILIFR